MTVEAPRRRRGDGECGLRGLVRARRAIVHDRLSRAEETGADRRVRVSGRWLVSLVVAAAVVSGALAQSDSGESGLNKILTAMPTAGEKRAPGKSVMREPQSSQTQAVPSTTERGATETGVAAAAAPPSPSAKLERLPLGPAGDAKRSSPPSGESGGGAIAERKAWAMPRVSGPMLALGAVLGLILILAGLARLAARGRASTSLRAEFGAGGRSPAGLLEVIGRYPIARGATLVLLRLDRRILLLSMSSGLRGGTSFGTLCEVSDPEEVASILVHARDAEGDSMAERFRSLLAKSDERMKAPRVEAAPVARGGAAGGGRPLLRASAIEVKSSDGGAAAREALAQRLAAARSAAGMPVTGGGGGAARNGARGASPRLKDVSA